MYLYALIWEMARTSLAVGYNSLDSKRTGSNAIPERINYRRPQHRWLYYLKSPCLAEGILDILTVVKSRHLVSTRGCVNPGNQSRETSLQFSPPAELRRARGATFIFLVRAPARVDPRARYY